MSWLNKLRGQDGATLIMVTLATVLLFGFAALAVDVGHGMGERRQAQSTADASVLASVVEVNTGSVTLQGLVNLALQFADANAPSLIPLADWVNRCPDTSNPAEQLHFTANDFGLNPPTDCISWSETFDEMRVSLPQQDVETFFAGVIGIDSFDVTAFAEASFHLQGVGNPPPFVVVDGTQGGEEICLRVKMAGATLPEKWEGNGPTHKPMPPPTMGIASMTGGPDPCSDGEYLTLSQLRGTLSPYIYASCTQPGNAGMDSIIANGIDHFLGVDYDKNMPNPKVDGDGCKPLPQAFPNTMDLQNGTTAQILKDGLLDGGTFDKQPFTGRLQQGNFVGGPTDPRFAGKQMDNEPLWEFIDHTNIAGLGAPNECVELSTAYKANDSRYDYFDLKELMIKCIQKWNNGNPIFRADIQHSSRFFFIPQIEEEALDVTVVHFINFVPVWLQKLYQEGTENNPAKWDPFCFVQDPSETGTKGWFVHEAGQDFDCGKSVQNLDAIGSIVIECGMLPRTLCVPSGSPGGNPGGNPVISIELTR